MFQGEEELFRELAIHKHWDWSKINPVVRLSFGGMYSKHGNLENDIRSQLSLISENEGLKIPFDQQRDTANLFRYIINSLHRKSSQKVVVLVDEYDKPVLDTLENPELATANRDYLRGFYGIIKDCASDVEFVFITGVSMFTKVSLFSGLNNLKNISLDARYATICGYTEAEIDDVFVSELVGLDRDEIRRWYNGYHWRGGIKVYNPFDVLLLLDSREFYPHWFETGSPEFLFRTLINQEVSPMELENRMTTKGDISTFDLGKYDVDSLLFQTGYLTIIDEKCEGPEMVYRLGYPNFEVRQSLNHGLLKHITAQNLGIRQSREPIHLLIKNDFKGFGDQLKSFLSGVPYLWHDRGNLSHFESWYASMLYMSFCSAGVDIRLEDVSSRGRADIVVLMSGQIFVFEFKMVEDRQSAGKAMIEAIVQIRERGYSEKYCGHGQPIHLVGLVFGREERNLLEVRAES